MKRAQSRAGDLPLGHRQGERRHVEVHGSQVAEEGRVAGRAFILDLQDEPKM